MDARTRLTVLFLFGVLVGCAEASPQTRPGRPVLIRDTDTAEGKDEAEAAKEKPFNPLEAEKSLKIGDYYLKSKNYNAAIQRYMEALQYQPNLYDAWDALARAYEKMGDRDKAIRVCKEFLEKYPDSSREKDFREKLSRLEKK